MSVRSIAISSVVATTFVAAPVQAATYMNATFNTTSMTPAGPFNSTASVNPIGTVDDTANGGGIWKGNQIDSLTADSYGRLADGLTLDGGLRLRSRTVSGTPVGGVVNGDIGQNITSGTVSVHFDLRRATRGGIIGGRSTEQLTNAAGDGTDMLFGVIWEHNFFYNINPNGYYGDNFQSVPNANANWSTLDFVLNFETDTYSVSVGETATLWTNLPMNTTAGNDFLRYIYIEAIPVQGSNVFYDNIRVESVPEPGCVGLVSVVGAALLCRRRAVAR